MSDSSVIQYAKEARSRLLRFVIVFVLVSSVCLFFSNLIYAGFTLPLIKHFAPNQSLIAIHVISPFMVPLKGALLLSCLLVFPYGVYQAWRFILPALYRQERRLARYILISAIVLFYLGVAFSFYVVLPLVFKFLLSSVPQGVEFKPDIGLYLSFIARLILVFGVSFEVPIMVLALVASGLVSLQRLTSIRAYVLVLSFVVAMFLTPPDVISQVLLAIPLYGLYELGIVLAKVCCSDAATTKVQ